MLTDPVGEMGRGPPGPDRCLAYNGAVGALRLRWVFILVICAAATSGWLCFNALAAAGPGTDIGDAEVLTGSASNTLQSAVQDDWYVIYPSSPAAEVTVQIMDTSASMLDCNIYATLTDTNGEGQFNQTLNAGQEGTLSSTAPSDRYFVHVTINGCSPINGPSSYQLQLTAGGGGTPPSPASGSVSPGTSMRNAGGPLLGHTSYTGRLPSVASDDWYVLYKHADTNQATVRIEDTSPFGAGCGNVYAQLTSASSGDSQFAHLGNNQAQTLAVVAPGPYYLELHDNGCNPGSMPPATYRVEPEPAGEWDAAPTPPPPPVTLAISTATLPPATVGKRYSARITATGGHGPYSFRLLSGSLPQGLTLSGSGLIAGTPQRSGRFTLQAQVRDSSQPQQSATRRLTLTVANPKKPPGGCGMQSRAQLKRILPGLIASDRKAIANYRWLKQNYGLFIKFYDFVGKKLLETPQLRGSLLAKGAKEFVNLMAEEVNDHIDRDITLTQRALAADQALLAAINRGEKDIRSLWRLSGSSWNFGDDPHGLTVTR